jgi:hypothetical protein
MQTINTGAHMPETEPFPTPVLVVALILLAVAIASVLLFRKHKNRRPETPRLVCIHPFILVIKKVADLTL